MKLLSLSSMVRYFIRAAAAAVLSVWLACLAQHRQCHVLLQMRHLLEVAPDVSKSEEYARHAHAHQSGRPSHMQAVSLQLLGFSDWATGTLSVCLTLGAALGFLTGGWLSDALAWRFPNAARPFINQLSAAMTLPLTIVLYKAMPGRLTLVTARLVKGLDRHWHLVLLIMAHSQGCAPHHPLVQRCHDPAPQICPVQGCSTYAHSSFGQH